MSNTKPQIPEEPTLGAWHARAILLVDLDAFFASVEQLDHPGWRGKPVIVGGSPDRRGVVSTCSYEARAYGVRSAMASSTAARLCPNAIWTEGNFHRYREVSNAVMDILHDETPFVQQVSIDEAFMDVSPNEVNTEHPVHIARRIQSRVEELGVSCSIGAGTTKAIAKLASDMDKPRGLTVVYPGSEKSFLAPLPIRSLSGIGKATELKLQRYGIETLGELAAADDAQIKRQFGKVGTMLLARARGEDLDPVEADDEIKSVSSEISFAEDLRARSDIEAAIMTMLAKVCRRLRRKGLRGRTLSLKVRYADRSVRSVQRKLERATDDESDCTEHLHEMLGELWSVGMALRLVGVGIAGFEDGPEQESLFDDLFQDESADQPSRHRDLAETADRVKERFGENSLHYGRELRVYSNTTGSSSKNPADMK